MWIGMEQGGRMGRGMRGDGNGERGDDGGHLENSQSDTLDRAIIHSCTGLENSVISPSCFY